LLRSHDLELEAGDENAVLLVEILENGAEAIDLQLQVQEFGVEHVELVEDFAVGKAVPTAIEDAEEVG